MSRETLTTRCCVAGGGPAGMMLGLLLARAGVDVVVLEKHADFLRDFRGDTIHPSTLELMHELGWLEEFLELPHQKAPYLRFQSGSYDVVMGDFTHLPTHARFIAFMPQWDFLNFLARKGSAYPGFHLRMRAKVTELIREGNRVVGVLADTPEGTLEVRSELLVAADGRGSTVREKAGLAVQDFGAPMDVLWFRIPREPGDPVDPMGRFENGQIFIMINRTDAWQCGRVIPKGSYEQVRARGLDAFREDLVRVARFTADRVSAIRDWEDVKLLTVRVDRLSTWYQPGLLCIGDAAHAMSPVGGVGINLAIQDAVAAANLLAGPLREGRLDTDLLRQVQRRRELPTRLIQRMQVLIQDNVLGRALRADGLGTNGRLPWPVRLASQFPVLRRIPARLIGLGIRPEHVRSPESARI
ncbi:FAD-dependent oxidoreductase [Archangium violaceum]|uniref:FAD-dependent oxidoreductase n=1 Tax=Archangium violaceum TaxID=83451 RepID=UPI002B2822B0|nr:FAD-dependent oxidoreductase [Archangium violaceum]